MAKVDRTPNAESRPVVGSMRHASFGPSIILSSFRYSVIRHSRAAGRFPLAEAARAA
jgi:hypothetical protein